MGLRANALSLLLFSVCRSIRALEHRGADNEREEKTKEAVEGRRKR